MNNWVVTQLEGDYVSVLGYPSIKIRDLWVTAITAEGGEIRYRHDGPLGDAPKIGDEVNVNIEDI